MGKTIVHVHLLTGICNYKSHCDLYFGSIAAIFSRFKASDIGFTETYLRHANLGSVINKKVIIKRCEVIVSPRRREEVEK